jgi:hypothetical protein
LAHLPAISRKGGIEVFNGFLGKNVKVLAKF